MSCVTISRIALLAIVAANGSMLTAQQAKVRIKVHPPEAQIFVDGKTQGKGPAKEIKTTAGVHTVIVVNYGTLSSLSRFTAGVASTSVAVAPVLGRQFSLLAVDGN